jgi:hypothetical protein
MRHIALGLKPSSRAAMHQACVRRSVHLVAPDGWGTRLGVRTRHASQPRHFPSREGEGGRRRRGVCVRLLRWRTRGRNVGDGKSVLGSHSLLWRPERASRRSPAEPPRGVAARRRGVDEYTGAALRTAPPPSPTHIQRWQQLRVSGGRCAHAAVSRRPPSSLSRIVARTQSYTYAANVWALCLVQGQFLRPVPDPLMLRFATSFYRIAFAFSTRHRRHSPALRRLPRVPSRAPASPGTERRWGRERKRSPRCGRKGSGGVAEAERVNARLVVAVGRRPLPHAAPSGPPPRE